MTRYFLFYATLALPLRRKILHYVVLLKFLVMGFFSKLLGNVVSDAIGSTIRKVQENQDYESSYSEPASESRQKESVTATTGGHTRAYFKDILYSEFSKYTVRENIPVSEIGGEGKSYDFGLYENGILKGFVVLVEHNRDNNKAYKDSKLYANRANIPFINFYLHMPNEKKFVIYRINHLLN